MQITASNVVHQDLVESQGIDHQKVTSEGILSKAVTNLQYSETSIMESSLPASQYSVSSTYSSTASPQDALDLSAAGSVAPSNAVAERTAYSYNGQFLSVPQPVSVSTESVLAMATTHGNYGAWTSPATTQSSPYQEGMYTSSANYYGQPPPAHGWKTTSGQNHYPYPHMVTSIYSEYSTPPSDVKYSVAAMTTNYNDDQSASAMTSATTKTSPVALVPEKSPLYKDIVYESHPFSANSASVSKRPAASTLADMAAERNVKRARRNRTSFTTLQLARLEEEFDNIKYPDIYRREQIAEQLNLREEIIRVWFKNRRQKLKKSAHLTNL